MAKDGKVFLANGAWARYDRVDPPYGGFLFFDAKRPVGFVLRVFFGHRSMRSKWRQAVRQLTAVSRTNSSAPAARTISCIP